MKKMLMTTAVASTAFLALAFGQGGTFKTGLEVMQAQDKRPAPKSQTMTMTMEITRGGTTLTRTMKSWTMGKGDKSLLKFQAPADVKGSGFLSIKNGSGVLESYLWLPAIGRVRRLSSSDNSGSFFGSDLSNEDLGNREVKDYDYKLLEAKADQYVVEATPKKDSSYEKSVQYIDAKSLLTTKSEYYRDGAIYKTFVIGDVASIKNYSISRLVTVETPSLKSKTVLKLSDIQVDTALNEEIFTERNLKK
jgi:outer membrane lipoprotein-sorting protein